MDIKTSERILKVMIEIKQHDCLNNPIPDLIKVLPDLSEDVILAAIAYFKKIDLINPLYGDETVACIVIKPAAIGHLRKIQEDQEDQEQRDSGTASIQKNFNFKNNYGAVGTNTNLTINNSFDFSEFETLVKNNTKENSVDRKELEELQKQLEDIVQHNNPISKGYLSQFSEIMQKHSWIAGPLAGFLIKWVTG